MSLNFTDLQCRQQNT